MNDEQELEQQLQDKGLTAPRITPEMLDAAIVSEEYHLFENSHLTVCVLTLKNGTTVIGDAPLVSAENFDEEIGRDIARKNARDKVWQVLGVLLREYINPSNMIGA